jgi:hypothetical protein
LGASFNISGIAKALTVVSQNGGSLDGITTNTLEALSATNSYIDSLDELNERLSNFNYGEDYGDNNN